MDAFGPPGMNPATISSSYYRLVRYAEVAPKQFVCKGDAGTKEFSRSDYADDYIAIVGMELTELWDFGPTPGIHCSYSYHMPYSFAGPGGTTSYSMNASSSPKSPLCADRNPFIDKNADSYIWDPPTVYGSGWVEWDKILNVYRDPVALAPGTEKYGNAYAHLRETQNVLYNDFHVEPEPYPNIGIEQDNIWKRWSAYPPPLPTSEMRQRGGLATNTATVPTKVGDGHPMAYEDAYLVNERNDD
jgi:hypothetical protein